MLRRLFALLLLMFLPLQFSWAAVAGYCQHEAAGGVSHPGHHQHQHQVSHDGPPATPEHAADGNVSPLPEGEPAMRLALDDDCAACHAGCAVALPALAVAWPALPTAARWLAPPLFPASLPSDLPDRPNWLAAR